MFRLLIKRLLQAAVVLLGVALMIFLMLQVVPGNPVTTLMGEHADRAAIARMTSVPARRFGIKGRGVLEKGSFADIAVWRETEFHNTATYSKSHSFCTGMEKVFVNGALAYDSGVFTHAGTGQFLER